VSSDSAINVMGATIAQAKTTEWVGDVQLLIPADDVCDPELSIVVPALNEELTIADFVAWCHEGMEKAGIRGEILIIDSSKDRTAELALASNARVLKTPKRGLGRAYIDSLPFIRGKYVLMGDCDCTYDFRELADFVGKFRAGYDYIMGSRFKGYIEPGSMPALHRYFGTPGTTWILNVLYATRFSDIHCGMRGISTRALRRMDLLSQSWEYASEMVLKSVRMNLKTAEVPVRFLKDVPGRLSHHKRSGWFSPWQAAWINLRAMFVYGADFFVFRPGIALLGVGLLLTLPLSMGPLTIGPVTFSLYWMLLGLAFSILGLQSFYLGCIAQVLCDYTGEYRKRWLKVFSYTRSVFLSAAVLCTGAFLLSFLVRRYFALGLSLPGDQKPFSHLAVTGLLLVIAGFMNFVFTLVLHAASIHSRRRDAEID
jgi:glycosyltransferase involved in cell wall biosynthesis